MLLALGLVATWIITTTSRNSAGTPTGTVEGIIDSLECTSVEAVLDDLSFFDSMTGVNCYHGDEPPTLVRIYEREASPAQVLQDWAPVLTERWQAVIGPNWFVIGQPSRIRAFALIDNTTDITRVVPMPEPLSQRQDNLTSCITFMSGAALALAVGPGQHDQQAPSLDQEYPGAGALLQSLVPPSKQAEIRGVAEENSLSRDAYLSRFGPALKRFCESILP